MESKCYIQKLIAEGEHLNQDFKHSINDSKKIARSLSAFANTSGGRLLIGVRDNGSIAGISSDEEYHMVEAAAQMYTKPEVIFTSKSFRVEGKSVLEISIPKSKEGPHLAPTKEDEYKAYVRVDDQNIIANPVLLKVWERKKRETGTLLEISRKEEILLDFLKTNKQISLSKFAQIAKLRRRAAVTILVNLVSVGIIKMNMSEKSTTYSLASED